MERQKRLKSFVTSLGGAQGQAGGFESAFPPARLETLLQTSPFAKSERDRERVFDIHQRLLRNEPLLPDDVRLYEAIILPTERPPLLINNGSFARPPEPWAELDEPLFRKKIETAIASVGRLELSGADSPPFAGTGFVVGPGLLMTNRHVARIFGQGSGTRVRFIDGRGSAIDFLREHGSQRRDLHAVAEIVFIHPYWDMALLRVADLETPPLSLSPVHPDDHKGRRVVVIGYPFEDERNPLDLQYEVFDGQFGVKRLQPGYARGQAQYTTADGMFEVFTHDSSTLGGNSGSAVIDPATGNVVALHFAGEYAENNYAVPSFELARDGRVRDAGVSFSAGSAEVPNPWQAAWDAVESPPPDVAAPTLPREPAPDSTARRAPALGAAPAFTIPIDIEIRVGRPN